MRFVSFILGTVALLVLGFFIWTRGEAGPKHTDSDFSHPVASGPSVVLQGQPATDVVERREAHVAGSAPELPAPVAKPWRDDPAKVAAIINTFTAELGAWMLDVESDVKHRELGTRALKEGLWSAGVTNPALQFKLEDLSQLQETEKLYLCYLLEHSARKAVKYRNTIPKDLEAWEFDQVQTALKENALYWPPEMVMESLGISGKLNDPEYLSKLQYFRIEILNFMAPSLVVQEYHYRFALKAAMMNGVDPKEFLPEDGMLISPELREHESYIVMLNQEFYEKCRDLASE